LWVEEGEVPGPGGRAASPEAGAHKAKKKGGAKKGHKSKASPPKASAPKAAESKARSPATSPPRPSRDPKPVSTPSKQQVEAAERGGGAESPALGKATVASAFVLGKERVMDRKTEQTAADRLADNLIK
jgi:hypothetical protein